VEEEVRRLLGHLPGEIKLRRAALTEEERRVGNFIEFIGDGKATPALFQALRTAEEKVTSLQSELRAIEASAADAFKTPPIEWVVERLTKIGEVLEVDTVQSALILRRAFGPIRLIPIKPQVGRPYYQAETAVRVLDPPRGPGRRFELITLVDAVATNSNRRRVAIEVSAPRDSTTISLPASS
jgi:hypothetical protein